MQSWKLKVKRYAQVVTTTKSRFCYVLSCWQHYSLLPYTYFASENTPEPKTSYPVPQQNCINILIREESEKYFIPCEVDRANDVECRRGHFCRSPGARCYSNQSCCCCCCCCQQCAQTYVAFHRRWAVQQSQSVAYLRERITSSVYATAMH